MLELLNHDRNKIGKVIDTYYTLGNHDDISIAEEPGDILCYFILLFQFDLWREMLWSDYY
jgi:uncharacterized protein with GYD domain